MNDIPFEYQAIGTKLRVEELQDISIKKTGKTIQMFIKGVNRLNWTYKTKKETDQAYEGLQAEIQALKANHASISVLEVLEPLTLDDLQYITFTQTNKTVQMLVKGVERFKWVYLTKAVAEQTLQDLENKLQALKNTHASISPLNVLEPPNQVKAVTIEQDEKITFKHQNKDISITKSDLKYAKVKYASLTDASSIGDSIQLVVNGIVTEQWGYNTQDEVEAGYRALEIKLDKLKDKHYPNTDNKLDTNNKPNIDTNKPVVDDKLDIVKKDDKQTTKYETNRTGESILNNKNKRKEVLRAITLTGSVYGVYGLTDIHYSTVKAAIDNDETFKQEVEQAKSTKLRRAERIAMHDRIARLAEAKDDYTTARQANKDIMELDRRLGFGKHLEISAIHDSKEARIQALKTDNRYKDLITTKENEDSDVV